MYWEKEKNREEKEEKKNKKKKELKKRKEGKKNRIKEKKMGGAKKQTHRSMERIENPEVDPHLYGQLIFDKGGKTIHWKKVSSINGAGEITHPHAEE